MVLRRSPRPEKCRDSVQVRVSVADRGLLVPVQLDDPILRDSPAAQVGADTERDEERRGLGAQQLPHRRQVEVVVVIMGDDDRVEPR